MASDEGRHWITLCLPRGDEGCIYHHVLVRDRTGEIVGGPRPLHGAKFHVLFPTHPHTVENLRHLARSRQDIRNEITRLKKVESDMLADVRKSARSEYKEAKKAPSLIAQIQKAGKIRPSRDYDRGTIPLALLSKRGQPLDSMATEMGFEDSDQLLAAIESDRAYRRTLNPQKMEETAIERFKQSDEYQTLKLLQNAMVEALPKTKRHEKVARHAKKKKKKMSKSA